MATLSDYLSNGIFGVSSGASVYLSGYFGDGVEGVPLGGAGGVPGPPAGSIEDILSDVEYPDIAAVAAQQLSLSWELPSSRQTVILGDTLFEVQITYRRRSASWYLSLWDLSGNLVLGGRRLSPGWAANLGRQGGPDGLLLVTGPDDYRRDDLGSRLRLTFYPRSDVQIPQSGFTDTLVDFGG